MSRVIRVSDEVYERLQQLAEPFVDTPSAVIARLLDQAEVPNVETKEDQMITLSTDAPGVFLAPASTENIKATLINKVTLDQVRPHVDADTLQRLEEALGGASSFGLWAMTVTKAAQFRKMKPGAYVLFAETDTGYFTRFGRVIFKFKSDTLGGELWNVTPRQPWTLIYALDDITRIRVRKPEIVSEFGYEPNFAVPGVIAVRDEGLAKVLQKYGSVTEFVDSLR